MSGLIWIQAVWHSDDIPEIFFRKKVDFEKNQKTTKRYYKGMQSYPAVKKLNVIKFLIHVLYNDTGMFY